MKDFTIKWILNPIIFTAVKLKLKWETGQDNLEAMYVLAGTEVITESSIETYDDPIENDWDEVEMYNDIEPTHRIH